MQRQKGDDMSALDNFIRALELGPGREETWLHMGQIHEALNRPFLAMPAYLGAVRANPNSVAGYTCLGQLLEQSNNDDGALQVRKPYTSFAFASLEMFHSHPLPPHLGRDGRAYEKAVGCGGPQSVLAHSRVLAVLRRQGRM